MRVDNHERRHCRGDIASRHFISDFELLNILIVRLTHTRLASQPGQRVLTGSPANNLAVTSAGSVGPARMVRKPFAGDQQSASVRSKSQDQLSIRVLSHNIRYATSSPFKNEKPWKDRFPLVASQLKYHTRFCNDLRMHRNCETSDASSRRFNASFICMQEVLHNQLCDILNALNSQTQELNSTKPRQWSYIGVGREDGKTKGEYSPILYPAQVFDLLHFENTWLSPTPNKPSKGWDAGSERILTTGVFEHKKSKKRLAVFNTHLDNEGSVAREKSVAIILDTIQRVRLKWATTANLQEADDGGDLQFILAGDFNSFPEQEAYRAIVASNTMSDVHDVVPAAERYGNEVTFTGFQPDTDEDKDEIGRIDFVWLGPKGRVRYAGGEEDVNGRQRGRGWVVEGYAVLPNVFDDGVFCSDHRAVIIDAVLK